MLNDLHLLKVEPGRSQTQTRNEKCELRGESAEEYERAIAIASTAGAYVHLFTDLLSGGGILYSLLAAGLAFGLFLTPDNGKNRSTRMAMLLGFGFLTGLGMGPLLQLAIMMNPSIVPPPSSSPPRSSPASLAPPSWPLTASISTWRACSPQASQPSSGWDSSTFSSDLRCSSRLTSGSDWRCSAGSSCSTLS